jgi:hypothetical protein
VYTLFQEDTMQKYVAQRSVLVSGGTMLFGPDASGSHLLTRPIVVVVLLVYEQLMGQIGTLAGMRTKPWTHVT